MLVTMIIIVSLLAGAATLVSLQLSTTRSAGYTKQGMSSMYCAEAGLTAAHSMMAANHTSWAATLAADPTGSTQPSWLGDAAFSHDLDGDGVDDFKITIKDNDDEIAPAANNASIDIDDKVFLIATCTKYVETPSQIEELISYRAGGTCYDAQQGGCAGNANAN
jgi:hypothetical protein